METILFSGMAIAVLAGFGWLIGWLDKHSEKPGPTHHDSRPGSFYHESQKKQWDK